MPRSLPEAAKNFWAAATVQRECLASFCPPALTERPLGVMLEVKHFAV
jgi:hypothetical protein